MTQSAVSSIDEDSAAAEDDVNPVLSPAVRCAQAQETRGVPSRLVQVPLRVPLRVPPAELAPVVQLSGGQEAEAPPPDAALEPCANANSDDIGIEQTEDVEEVGGEEQQLDVVDVLRQSLDVLAGALWRPPRGTGRSTSAPCAHHPLSIGLSGPIPAQRGLRVVLTHEYRLRPDLDVDCCLTYAHKLKFMFGKHLGKTFSEVMLTRPEYEAECRKRPRPGPLMQEYIAYCDIVKGVKQPPRLPTAPRTRIPDSLTMQTDPEPWEPPALPLCPLHAVGTVTEIFEQFATCKVLWDTPRSSRSCVHVCVCMCVCVCVCARACAL